MKFLVISLKILLQDVFVTLRRQDSMNDMQVTHTIMLPPPCFMVGRIQRWGKASDGLLFTRQLPSLPYSLNFDSSLQITDFQMCGALQMNFLANFSRFSLFARLMRSFLRGGDSH
jgi:hypothetical protein